MNFQDLRKTADRVRAVPLEAVLVRLGAKRDRHDRAKWHTAQGAVSVTGTKFINWNRSRGGGGAIDLAIHLNGMDFKTAVQWLADHFPAVAPAETPPPPRRPRLELPPRDARKLARVRHYLIHERGLRASLIESLIERRRLYADPRGNAVFVLLGEEARPVGAELRGTSGVPWRGLAPGSRKDLGYFSVGVPHPAEIVLCESAVDAVSFFTLYPRGLLCISTAGARPNPRWLGPLIQTGLPIYCAFDADPTGDAMARAMIALHPTVKRFRPTCKDWNDVLRSR